MTTLYDYAIIGAGMAGASLAAELAGRARVVVLEAESTPGYHATGRSAAFWHESFGGVGVQPLTTASGPQLNALGVLKQRDALTIANQQEIPALEKFAQTYGALGIELAWLDRAALAQRIPGLRADWLAGVLEPNCCDIDVAALHQHYLAVARKSGAELRCRAGLLGANWQAGSWQLDCADGHQLAAKTVINAAGAWADAVAELAGIKPIGIQPLRRTMVQLRTAPAPPDSLPLVLHIAEKFYFKPEAGHLWLSPEDEGPSKPCDAAPDEFDVATAIDRLEQVVDWQIERVVHKWAGLRSFAPDRLPVYGFDPQHPGFFWFAGQGGFGIQTAPAAAKLAAGLLLGGDLGAVDPAPYAPGRFNQI